MPSTPYAKLFASISSGALQDDGITAIVTDTVDLSAESTVGWITSGVSAPKWEIYGRSAGALRNRAMLDLKPDLVLAFRVAMSSGTTDCIDEARMRGIPVEVVDR